MFIALACCGFAGKYGEPLDVRAQVPERRIVALAITPPRPQPGTPPVALDDIFQVVQATAIPAIPAPPPQRAPTGE